MKRYLLDSNALNLFVFRRGGVYQRTLAARRSGAVIGTALPVVAEILGGTWASDTAAKNLPKVNQALATLRFWPFDLAAVREYGRLFAELRRDGVQMQVMDRMIAAIALTLPNCTVVTSDSDFSRVPGLRVEDWSELPPAP
jgi:tRNA(fMet)-specific endonuclease VapC